MDLRDLIEQGNRAAGTQVLLADAIGVSSMMITNAKAGRAGLPGFACVRLAKLIGAEPMAVIAASELNTEKKEERRAEWLPFVQNEWRRGCITNPLRRLVNRLISLSYPVITGLFLAH